MKNLKISNIVIVFLILFVLFKKNTYAYLDPGTGSFILQMLAAGALGTLFAIKTFWRQIINFLTKILSRKGKKPEKKTQKKNNDTK